MKKEKDRKGKRRGN